MDSRRKTFSALAYLAVVAAMATGCRAPKMVDFKPSKLFSMKSAWPFRDPDEPEEGTPVRVVGTWTDTVLTQPGPKPQRGFGGRLVFYGRDDKQPILVDGQLVVYAFDETSRDPTDNKPTRRYVFPPDQVPHHMSKSEIGASYSFWLPWDEAGGPRTEVSLICRFEPRGGAVITSEQTRHLLPGSLAPQSLTASRQPPQLPEGVPSRPARPTLESMLNARRTDGIQQASYENSVDSPVAANQATVATASLVPERKMSVTSIKLPNNFQFPAANNAVNSAPVASNGTDGSHSPQPPTIQQQAVTPLGQPAVTTSAVSAAPGRPAGYIWQTTPAAQTTGGFGSPQLVRPQLVTPQFMSLQPAPASTGVPTTVSPQQAAVPQPAVR